MNSSIIAYRPLKEGDIGMVAALEAATFPTPWTADQYAAVMRQGGCALFGAFAGEKLAGYIAVNGGVGEMEVYNIAVDEAYRRSGIGKKLLSLSLAAGAKNGVVSVFLEVRESNIPAIGLYESLGFVKSGVRKRYYRDTGEDALVYFRSLA